MVYSKIQLISKKKGIGRQANRPLTLKLNDHTKNLKLNMKTMFTILEKKGSKTKSFLDRFPVVALPAFRGLFEFTEKKQNKKQRPYSKNSVIRLMKSVFTWLVLPFVRETAQ